MNIQFYLKKKKKKDNNNNSFAKLTQKCRWIYYNSFVKFR